MSGMSSTVPAPRAAAVAISRVAVIVPAAYVGAQMLADIASLKIGVVMGLAVDMGTFIYPITFTLRDVVHKVLGKRNAQTLIVAAAVINLIMAAYLAWAARVPSDPTWGLGDSFSAILGPIWRIVIASIVAEVVSELIDTLIFTVIAFGPLPGLADDPLSLPWGTVWQIFLFNVVVKFAVTLISLPLIYTTPDPDWSMREEADR